MGKSGELKIISQKTIVHESASPNLSQSNILNEQLIDLAM